MCRIFTTCLTGEAWDWYMTLPRRFITRFSDLAKAFLKRYTFIKPSLATCEMFLDIVQGPHERTGAFVNRFIQASRKIPDLKEEFALATIKRGLRKGGLGTLCYEVHMKKMTTLRDFVSFAEGYIRAEDDNRSPGKPRSRSPRTKDETWQPRSSQSKGPNSSRKTSRPQYSETRRDDKEEYRSWFDRYAPFTKP